MEKKDGETSGKDEVKRMPLLARLSMLNDAKEGADEPAKTAPSTEAKAVSTTASTSTTTATAGTSTGGAAGGGAERTSTSSQAPTAVPSAAASLLGKHKASLGGGPLKMSSLVGKIMLASRLSRQYSVTRRSSESTAAGGGKSGHKTEWKNNTYKLRPEPGTMFQPRRVRRMAEDVLARKLRRITYNAKICRELTKLISDEIRIKVKYFAFKRYKIVVHVTIGEKKEQSVQVVSRSLCDTTTDNSATAVFENNTLFSVATVYGFYME